MKYYAQIDETVIKETLTNGLEVFIIPKPGFQKTYVTLTAKYGSIHNQFMQNGTLITMPEGIAHFLEHKMFEKEAGDMFNQFSSSGASANAFTSYDRTSYMFTTIDELKENIKLLLEMVQQPYFSERSVQKEIGIIAEEIRMYQDQPNYRLYHQTLQGMYNVNPVRQDIAGTVESINEINAEKLYTCYNTFYRPNNMVMFLVGNVDESILPFIAAHQHAQSGELPVLELQSEPFEVNQHRLQSTADVSKPRLMLGFKSNIHHSDVPLIQSEMEVTFILDMLLGEQTEFYQTLLQEGLIDETFGYSFSLEPAFSHILIAGNTDDPDMLKSRILTQLSTFELNNKDFDRLVKLTIGEFISSLNSPEYIANQFAKYYFNDAILFDVLPTLEALNLERALITFKEALQIENHTDSRLLPYD